MFLRKSICFTSILDVLCHNALFSLPPQKLNGLSACSRHKKCAHYGAKIWGGGGICTHKSGCFRPFVLLHRRIARGERRRPRALKSQPRFVGTTAGFTRRKSAYLRKRSKYSDIENRPDCSKRSDNRLFGRRSTLLHLSGFPCRYHRRVVATKFTTSNSLLYLIFIIAQLFRFVKIFLYINRSIVTQTLFKTPVVFTDYG